MDEDRPDEHPLRCRRDFLKGAFGVTVGALLFSTGAADRLIRFFSGPQMTPQQESRILGDREARHKETAEVESLEIERLGSESLLVGKLADLDAKTGKYFYDYQMRPALAFLGKDGLPLLISAKCTHLGCTVGNAVDAQGRLLCPCHLSHFDVASGDPTNGPAVLPLPLLGWALKDVEGRVVANRNLAGLLTGSRDPAELQGCSVFIARESKEGKSS
jgi:Rieske Fe-S protein